MNIHTFLFILLASLLPCPAQVLHIAAAADLRPAMDELKSAFEARHPGMQLQPSFGASGSLAAQIQQGAPFDLFLSADLSFPELLARNGLAHDLVFPYATGHLVLWVRKELGVDRDPFQALLDPAVKHVALANPAVAPYGRCAEAALKKLGLHTALKPRLVLGENVAQAAQFLQIGAAEAGFISLPQSHAPSLQQLGRAWTVPQELYPALHQGGIVLKRSSHLAQAASFRDFLLAGEGREILLKFGFGIP